MPDVAIVGGGITGLATAWFLRQRAPDCAVTLIDAGDRLGGKIRTTDWLGVPVEAGPDTFLARVPHAVDLCKALGLEGELVAPATSRAYVWTRGRLRPLPAGHVLGVPGRLGSLARSGIVSAGGVARATMDLVLPRRAPSSADPPVAEVVRARFGREVVERLVDPLLGGIHAGSTERLSLSSVAPAVAAAARSHRSLLLGLWREGGAAAGAGAVSGPVFLGIRGGLERLVDRLRERLERVDLRCGVRVESLTRTSSGRWLLGGSDGSATEAGQAVLTAPAFAAARLIAAPCPAAAMELAEIRYASVVTATLAYRRDAVPAPLDGSGFLVPAVDGRLMTACTWLTSKWPDLARSGRVLLRVSAGRFGDQRATELDDGALVARLQAELADAMGLREEPEAWLVSRWPQAFPQYEIGHARRVDHIETAVAQTAPGLILAGAAYRGLGIAACVEQAERAAKRVVSGLAAVPPAV